MTNLNSAMEPLLALDRWTRYTSLCSDTIQQREEEQAVHRIHQMQLDSIQGQVRDISQQCSELTDAVTELFNHIRHIRSALDKMIGGFNQHFDTISQNSLPATQLVSTQDAL